MMTLNRFMTRGNKTSAATRQVLKDVYKDLAPAAQKALLSPEMDYHIRYQFDSTCPGTGVPYGQWPTFNIGASYDLQGWYPNVKAVMVDNGERESTGTWKPIRLTSQGYKLVSRASIGDYWTVGYGAAGYAERRVKSERERLQAAGYEVEVRPINGHRVLGSDWHARRWSQWSEDYQIWARPSMALAARIAG